MVSPEVKTIIKNYVETQKEKYGQDWKKIKAKEMSEGPIGQTAVKLFEILIKLKK